MRLGPVAAARPRRRDVVESEVTFGAGGSPAAGDSTSEEMEKGFKVVKGSWGTKALRGSVSDGLGKRTTFGSDVTGFSTIDFLIYGRL